MRKHNKKFAQRAVGNTQRPLEAHALVNSKGFQYSMNFVLQKLLKQYLPPKPQPEGVQS